MELQLLVAMIPPLAAALMFATVDRYRVIPTVIALPLMLLTMWPASSGLEMIFKHFVPDSPITTDIAYLALVIITALVSFCSLALVRGIKTGFWMTAVGLAIAAILFVVLRLAGFI